VATPDAAPSDFQYGTRDASATHFLESGYDIRKDVKTTMIYTHVLNKGGHGVRSPVDAL
jgi:site-specific recombinase XerD